jgi:hypothetical protein
MITTKRSESVMIQFSSIRKVCLAAAMLFFACGSDENKSAGSGADEAGDDSEPSSKDIDAIVGAWRRTWGGSTTTLVFDEDGGIKRTDNSKGGSESCEGTWTVEGNLLVVTCISSGENDDDDTAPSYTRESAYTANFSIHNDMLYFGLLLSRDVGDGDSLTGTWTEKEVHNQTGYVDGVLDSKSEYTNTFNLAVDDGSYSATFTTIGYSESYGERSEQNEKGEGSGTIREEDNIIYLREIDPLRGDEAVSDGEEQMGYRITEDAIITGTSSESEALQLGYLRLI